MAEVPMICSKEDALKLLNEASKEIGRLSHPLVFLEIGDLQRYIVSRGPLMPGLAKITIDSLLKTDNPKIRNNEKLNEVRDWIQKLGRYSPYYCDPADFGM